MKTFTTFRLWLLWPEWCFGGGIDIITISVGAREETKWWVSSGQPIVPTAMEHCLI